MKYLIFILIAYWLLSRMRSKGGPHTPPPVPRQESEGLDYRPLEDDRPLRGPWDPSAGGVEEDVPLPGPWSSPAPAGDVETEVWADTDEPDPLEELEDEPAAAPVPLPCRDEERERRESWQQREPLYPREGLADCPVSPLMATGTENRGRFDVTPGASRQQAPGTEARGAGRGNPFASVLHHRQHLAASIILGEVLAFRGGRRKR